MGKFTVIKDPVYGYIQIPTDISKKIVNSSNFQRLRRIAQTSYASLYPSALHNRFVHSLGVYHLGLIASSALCESIKTNGDETLKNVLPSLDEYSRVFHLACLLHDVGHSPFSHIGENFLLQGDNNYTELHTTLSDLVMSPSFTEELDNKKDLDSAKPHEIMSAIIGLRYFSESLSDPQDYAAKEFFARCITGYRYSESTVADSIKNSFISLLNSEVIDVDRLDYLIRDSFVSGYDSVVIDYVRLLKSVTLIASDDTGTSFEVGFTKNAISVIENVVYAHDYERKWIQNHPTIQYDNFLLSRMIRELLKSIKVYEDDQEHKETKLFSENALTDVGVYCKFQEKGSLIPIRLLSDDDIVFLVKNIVKKEFSDEYFDRSLRRRPLWKSEAEYRTFITKIVGEGGEWLKAFSMAMESISMRFTKDSDVRAINSEYINQLEKKMESDEEEKKRYKQSSLAMENEINNIKHFYSAIQDANQDSAEIDAVLLDTSQFSSSFNKSDFKKIKIEFNIHGKTKICSFSEVVSSVIGVEPVKHKMFYLYLKSGRDSEPRIDLHKFLQELVRRYFPVQ